MILSVNGTLSVFAAYANLLTIATFLGIGVNTTKKYATHPVVKLILLYVFAYSVINDKLACLFAVALFTVVEVREFITDAGGDKIQPLDDEEGSSNATAKSAPVVVADSDLHFAPDVEPNVTPDAAPGQVER